MFVIAYANIQYHKGTLGTAGLLLKLTLHFQCNSNFHLPFVILADYHNETKKKKLLKEILCGLSFYPS